MNQVRKMPKEDQIKAIKQGYQKEIQRWHPDKNFGDDENAKEIIMAYEILKDEEKRARYNNEADYDNGWLSLKRWKAVFWPECVTEEQKKAYKHRMIMFALSLGILIGGIAVTVGTAGLAAPAVVATGAVFGGGFIGAGLQSLQHTVNRKSVGNECDKKQWLIKAGIGFVGGAATGGAAAGITAGVAGLGAAATESAALTMGQFLGIGAGSGAVGGVAQSLATDAARKFADGEDVTWKQVLGHAALRAAVGAAAGAAGGAVTKSVVGIEASAASANIEGEIGEQVAILTGASYLGRMLAQRIPRAVTENGTAAVMVTFAQFTVERLDDSVENRNPGRHLVEGVKNVAVSTVKGLAQETSVAIASHVCGNEIKVKMRLKEGSQQRSTPSFDDDTSVEEPRVDGDNEDITPERVGAKLSEENNEHRINWRSHSKHSSSYELLVEEEPSSDDQEATPEHNWAGAAGGAVSKSVVGIDASATSANIDGVIGKQAAILNGAKRPEKDFAQRISRAFTEKGTEAVMSTVAQFTEERLDDSVEIRNPGKHLVEGVKNVAVSTAKVLAQETSGAIASYAWNKIKVSKRLKKERSQQLKYSFSYEPLVQEEPSSHDQEATPSTTSEEDAEDEDQSEVSDAEDCKVKYISEGVWFSKMVVSYFLKGKRITQEARGSGESVSIPGSATQLEVKFQVRRPFWGDLMEYDRFKKCWCKPYKPHVFKFDTPPPLRTFTISGGLWWEAVMTVSDEYHDDTKEM